MLTVTEAENASVELIWGTVDISERPRVAVRFPRRAHLLQGFTGLFVSIRAVSSRYMVPSRMIYGWGALSIRKGMTCELCIWRLIHLSVEGLASLRTQG
jgi:hypothetical protein